MDPLKSSYETFDDLGHYLDRIASAVGRVTMQNFGIDPAKYAEYAVAGGHAVQLTNILCDVKEDFERWRVHIPQEDLRRFEVPESDLEAVEPTKRFRDLTRFQVPRKRRYTRRHDVLGKRVAVPGWRKATLGIGTWIRARLKPPLGR
jgi:phytoene synthase